MIDKFIMLTNHILKNISSFIESVLFSPVSNVNHHPVNGSLFFGSVQSFIELIEAVSFSVALDVVILAELTRYAPLNL